jgi:tetratricopeptide (TPR) repeat protein
LAQEQRQWQAAKQYYQKALAICVEFNDKHSQASTYHQLGIVAEKQRQWQAAEQYYQKALALHIEFEDNYEQAGTYHQLGYVAKEQEQWQQAKDYFFKALSLWTEFNDSYNVETFSLPAFARLHKATNDDTLFDAIAKVLGITVKEVTEKLQTAMKGKPILDPKIAEIMEQQRLKFGTDDLRIRIQKNRLVLAKIGGILGIIGYFFGGLKGSLIGFFIGGLGLPLLATIVQLFSQAFFKDFLSIAVAKVLGVSVKKATEKMQMAMKGKPIVDPEIAEIMEQLRSMFGTDDLRIIRRKASLELAKIGGFLGLIIGYFSGGLKGSLIGFFIGGFGLLLLSILVGLLIRVLVSIKLAK